MYKLWFKWKLGEDEFEVVCPTIECAQRTWDALSDAGAYAVCQRP